MRPLSKPCLLLLQDLTRFFGFALVLQLIMFALARGIKGKQHDTTAELVQSVVDVFVAAWPIGE